MQVSTLRLKLVPAYVTHVACEQALIDFVAHYHLKCWLIGISTGTPKTNSFFPRSSAGIMILAKCFCHVNYVLRTPSSVAMVISQAINCVLYTTKGLNEALSSKISVCSWLFFSGNDKMRSKALRIICGLFLLVTITLPLVKKKCQSCRLSEVIQLNNCLDNKPRLL